MNEYTPKIKNPIYDLLKQGRRVSAVDGGWHESNWLYCVDNEHVVFDTEPETSDDLRVISHAIGNSIYEYKLVEGNALQYRIVERLFVEELKWAIASMESLRENEAFQYVADKCIQLLNSHLAAQFKKLDAIRVTLTPDEWDLLKLA